IHSPVASSRGIFFLHPQPKGATPMYRTENRTATRRRSGFALVYGIIIMSLMLILSSLAVDYGRVQLVKLQCQAAADASANAAAAELPNGISAAQNAAISIAAANLIDGKAAVLDPATDIEFGAWDAATRTFTVLTG